MENWRIQHLCYAKYKRNLCFLHEGKLQARNLYPSPHRLPHHVNLKLANPPSKTSPLDLLILNVRRVWKFLKQNSRNIHWWWEQFSLMKTTHFWLLWRFGKITLRRNSKESKNALFAIMLCIVQQRTFPNWPAKLVNINSTASVSINGSTLPIKVNVLFVSLNSGSKYS